MYSVVGRTKTTPIDTIDRLNLAVESCSNYEFGYFNAYRAIANHKDLDVVLHLGDYIYEFGTGVYGDTTLGRTHVPRTEIITLKDYRLAIHNID